MSRSVWLVATSLSLSACAIPDQATFLTAPADPRLQPRAVQYSRVTSGAKTFSVVEPKDWREMNRRVAPQPSARGGSQ